MGQSGLNEQHCLLDTFNQGLVTDRVAFVIADVALLAQRIQHNHRALFQPDGFGESLNRGLMMSRLACGSAIAIRPQGHHCALHDGLVGSVEPNINADLIYPCIHNIAVRRLVANAAPLRASGYAAEAVWS